MKGLFTKDLIIIRNQWKTLAMILFCGIVISATNEPGTILAYLPILASMLAIGTMSYDEMDHSLGYLFTLPTSRKAYVKEKYVFSLALILLALAISFLVCIAMMMLSAEPPVIAWKEMLGTAGAVFSFIMLVIALEIPLRLKYGNEKGRIALYGLFGVLAVGAALLSKYYPETELSGISSLLKSQGFAILGAAAALSLLVLYLSSLLSTRILEEKEF